MKMSETQENSNILSKTHWNFLSISRRLVCQLFQFYISFQLISETLSHFLPTRDEERTCSMLMLSLQTHTTEMFRSFFTNISSQVLASQKSQVKSLDFE